MVAGFRPRSTVLPIALIAALALLLSLAAGAWAFGELSQKPGAAGCIAFQGADGCQNTQALLSVTGIAVSPDGQDVYAAAFGTGAVVTLSRDQVTGALTQVGCFAALDIPGCQVNLTLEGATDVAVSRDGRNVYVASHEAGALTVFDRGPTGALMPGGCFSKDGAGSCQKVETLSEADAVVVSPNGANVYVGAASGALQAFNRDQTTGSLTMAGCVSSNPVLMACELWPELGEPQGLSVSPDGGTVYATTGGDGLTTLKRDQASGALEKGSCLTVGGTGACAPARALAGAAGTAASPDGKNVYVASEEPGAVAVFDRVDSGALTQKPGTAGCISEDGSGGACQDGSGLRHATSVVVSPDGKNAYVTSGEPGGLAVFDRDVNGGLAEKRGLAACISEDGSGGACQDGSGLGASLDVAVSFEGHNLYVGSLGALAILDRSLLLPDTLAPTVSGFRLAPARFKARHGSRFRFGLSEPASARIAIERGLPGRRVGKHCQRPTRKLSHHRRCKRYVPRATLDYPGRATGANSIRFSGRLRGRALAAGAYRATIVATDPAGNASAPRRASFTVLPPGR